MTFTIIKKIEIENRLPICELCYRPYLDEEENWLFILQSYICHSCAHNAIPIYGNLWDAHCGCFASIKDPRTTLENPS